MHHPDSLAVRDAFSALQDRICAALEAIDGQSTFQADPRDTPGGGSSRPRVLQGDGAIEKAAVNFTHSRGDRLPTAATERRPELAGQPFEAVALSLIVHPRNPYAPTSHANLRFFVAGDTWWFGGGYDLTPFYGFDEDCIHWHQQAHDACAPHGPDLYPRFKAACDAYFFLPHRQEPRGIGGLFFEDLSTPGFAEVFALVCAVGDSYLPAYLPILKRRIHTPYGARERDFQLHRRGRYVEFNLVHDRGTRYGLQSGRRIEAVLASLPPLVRWSYDLPITPDSPEARLTTRYLVPRDWRAEADSAG